MLGSMLRIRVSCTLVMQLARLLTWPEQWVSARTGVAAVIEMHVWEARNMSGARSEAGKMVVRSFESSSQRCWQYPADDVRAEKRQTAPAFCRTGIFKAVWYGWNAVHLEAEGRLDLRWWWLSLSSFELP